MSTKDLLYPASFKGARFLAVGQMTTDGGRKQVDHEYPNSERRYIEDMGLKQRDFTIRGIIQGPNYKAKKEALIDALESNFAGRLVHPFYGSMMVKARPYTLTEDLTRVNTAIFTMSFGVDSGSVYPTTRGFFNFADLIAGLRALIDTLLNTDFSLDFGASILAVENLMTDVFDKFDDVTRKFAEISDNLSSIKNLVTKARGNIESIIRSPELLADFFEDTFEAMTNLFEDPKDTFDALSQLFGFSGGDSTRESSTVQRTEQNQNRDTINLIMNVYALSYGYANAKDIEYNSDEELLEIIEKLNDQYDNIIDELEEPLLSQINDLRDQFREFSDTLFLSLDKVITITVPKQPLTQLVQNYYGDLTKFDYIMNLNSIINPSEVEGSIKMLTE